jgi:hypothetical protein
MIYNLFLDDERKPKDVTWVELPFVNWIIARDYDNFVRIITQYELPVNISFDHDLADEHYRDVISGKGYINYDKHEEKTGYHCAKWLVEYCMDKKLPLPTCYIHTMNPIGKQNIQSLLDSYRKSCKMES